MVAIWALLCACTGTETRLPTDTPPDTTGTGGGVQRATVTVSVPVFAADAAVGSALGWSAVPGATVVLQRTGSAQSETATSDASGQVSFANVLPGKYAISVLRMLSDAERGQLGAGDADVDAFGGGVEVQVSAPTTGVQVPAAAGRRGSLVISELWKGFPRLGLSSYYFGHWLELYNNADTLVPLAGKLVFETVSGWYEHPQWPCSSLAGASDDPAGVWAHLIYAFPPNAAPVPPGGLVVIATDAIDHTTIVPDGYDLSNAGFEFRGGSDADNPAALDMLSVGSRDGGFTQGHGMYFIGRWQPYGIANAVDLSALPRFPHPSGAWEYVRIPGPEVLDIVTVRVPSVVVPFPDCQYRPVHPTFDRQFVNTGDPEALGLQRRALPRTTGHPILLRTKTSARDFHLLPPTPGALPQ